VVNDSADDRTASPGPAAAAQPDGPVPGILPRLPQGRDRLALVTGATGYIGGRLVPELLSAGFRVRVLVRHPERLRDRSWHDAVEIVAGDATDASAVGRSMAGVDVAYYLLHSLTTGEGFEAREEAMAQVFADAAVGAGAGRIVYLGGMVPDVPPDRLSAHLRGRVRTGEILRGSGVPTAELRAAVIIGSGSASFEMMRYLTERLPVMVTPRWVNTRTQPIAVRDVLHYLVFSADLPPSVNRTFDVGGPEVLTYRLMMDGYAAVAGLSKRTILPLNVLTPRLSSRWVGLVTPVPSSIARPLVDSLRYEVVRREHDLDDLLPAPAEGLLPFRTAVGLALSRVRDDEVRTSWASASVPGAPSDPLPSDPAWAGGTLYTDVREAVADAPIGAAWAAVEGIGGEHGWYSPDWMWEIRGLLDRAVGGVGLRRGRRDPDHLRVGDALDFWRVEERLPPHTLRLRAEMRLPGLAWLEYQLSEVADGSTRLKQRAVFAPRGLFGHAYWWSVAPFHAFVFGPMVNGLARRAGQLAASSAAAPQPSPAAA
jgi:uncharacterized protein YbjT (DUF2867 family)